MVGFLLVCTCWFWFCWLFFTGNGVVFMALLVLVRLVCGSASFVCALGSAVVSAQLRGTWRRFIPNSYCMCSWCRRCTVVTWLVTFYRLFLFTVCWLVVVYV